jgi:hypothetical protein
MSSFKLYFLPAIFMIVVIFFPGCENNRPNHDKIVSGSALNYNEFIVVRQKELMKDLEIFKLASEHDYKFASKMLDTILKHSTQSLLDIREMPPYKMDSSFREGATDLFNFYRKNFVPDCKKMILLKQKVDNSTATITEDIAFDEYLKKIKRQSGPIETRLEEIQVRFARKNNILLTRSSKGDGDAFKNQ